jgi:TetR/AcrR family transcriptional regulator
MKKRRDQILDEATRLFAEKGYDGTSMSDLAEGVGLRKASLFHHFESKEQLKAAVLDRLVREVGSAILSAASADAEFEQRLDALTDAIVDTLVSRPFAARLVVREAMDWSKANPHGANEVFDMIFTVLVAAERFVEAGQLGGIFVEGDARQIILTLLGAHFLPFAVNGVVEEMVGVSPFDPSFAEKRRIAMRAHVRGMLLVRKA